MRALSAGLTTLLAAACSSTTSSNPPTQTPDSADAGSDVEVDAPADSARGPSVPRSKIEHLVVIIQETHPFDAYFGRYCTAAPGSNPTCTDGPACCEAGPKTDPSGAAPGVLDDATNAAYPPGHDPACETAEIHGGKMDG